MLSRENVSPPFQSFEGSDTLYPFTQILCIASPSLMAAGGPHTHCVCAHALQKPVMIHQP